MAWALWQAKGFLVRLWSPLKNIGTWGPYETGRGKYLNIPDPKPSTKGLGWQVYCEVKFRTAKFFQIFKETDLECKAATVGLRFGVQA